MGEMAQWGNKTWEFFFVRDAQGNVLCVLVIGAQCQKAEHNAVVNRCMIIFLFIG